MKFPRWIANWRLFLFLLLTLAAWGGVGCSSTESANESSRPWNSPEGWENGSLPLGLTRTPR
jgi:hypothetical protein